MNSQQRYISNELTHFVGKEKTSEEQYQLLLKILKEGYITYPPHEKKDRNARELITQCKADFTKNEMYVSSMVCFCDIPVCDLSIHVNKYSPFGLSFDKTFIARKGGGPVYYVPKTAAPAWPVGQGSGVDRGDVFNRKIKECYHLLNDLSAENEWSDRAGSVQSFLGSSIFAYTKCFDHTLMDRHEDNYYFEREWRVLGNLKFNFRDVRRIIIPENYAVKFRKDIPDYCGQLTFATPPPTAADNKIERGLKMTDELQSQKSFTKKDMYDVARETRNMEISLFWQRSNYFLVLNTAIAVGFFSLKASDYKLIIGLFGCLVSILWVCINLGSKFWQSRWEQRLSLLERELGENINLFSADRKTVEDDVRESFTFSKYWWINKILNRLILTKPSVSRIMIWLSIIFVFLWLMLIIFTIVINTS